MELHLIYDFNTPCLSFFYSVLWMLSPEYIFTSPYVSLCDVIYGQILKVINGFQHSDDWAPIKMILI